ncbi:ABC transporter ATP-binding protein [Oscillibacter sp.]|uniref:ABC transporter ATP-binding protein n=1 Tax=Oscillibacter sp. TaxID=1945593 RepID=UPI0028997A68|nr:ABC transporter ATP-binding protein [Oscillibacter sp.]
MEIRLVNITKTFGGNRVIAPTDLTIESGSFTTLLGPSGCGKTTLLRMIAGLEAPDTGEIWFDDSLVFSAEKRINLPPENRGLGFVFQDFALWPHMTVFENVAFGLRAKKDTNGLEVRVAEALRAVQLENFSQRYPHQLSGGQQQRVAFARAIVIEPACVLFDEPLSALDALLREKMRRELAELVSRLRLTAVFVTHDQTEAMSMSDRIAVLNGGVVEQCDTPEHIYLRPATTFVARFVGKSNWLSPTELFRPEAMTLTPTEGYSKYDLPVTAIQYMGDAYEVLLQYQDVSWMLRSGRKPASGETVSVYIDPQKIIHCEREHI